MFRQSSVPTSRSYDNRVLFHLYNEQLCAKYYIVLGGCIRRRDIKAQMLA